MEESKTKNVFLDYLKDNLLDLLPKDIADNAHLRIEEVIKGNDLRLTGVMIHENDSNITPTIYIDRFIDRAEDGEDFHDLAQTIADRFMEARKEKFETFDLNRVTDFNEIKDRLVTKIINKDMSRDYLADIPYKEFGDLAIITQIKLDAKEGSQASITIRDEMLKRWDVDFDDVVNIATNNDLTKSTPRLYPMTNVLSSLMFGEDFEQNEFLPETKAETNPMYVFGTEDKVNGAKLLNQPKLLEQIADFLESDLILLPSSVHEIIVVPDNGSMHFDTDELTNMIGEINTNEVMPDDVLSGHPMFYSKDEKVLFFEKNGEKINMLFTSKDKDSIKDRLTRGKQKSIKTVNDSANAHKKNKEAVRI